MRKKGCKSKNLISNLFKSGVKCLRRWSKLYANKLVNRELIPLPWDDPE